LPVCAQQKQPGRGGDDPLAPAVRPPPNHGLSIGRGGGNYGHECDSDYDDCDDYDGGNDDENDGGGGGGGSEGAMVAALVASVRRRVLAIQGLEGGGSGGGASGEEEGEGGGAVADLLRRSAEFHALSR
jgi:hypothetical protein